MRRVIESVIDEANGDQHVLLLEVDGTSGFEDREYHVGGGFTRAQREYVVDVSIVKPLAGMIDHADAWREATREEVATLAARLTSEQLREDFEYQRSANYQPLCDVQWRDNSLVKELVS